MAADVSNIFLFFFIFLSFSSRIGSVTEDEELYQEGDPVTILTKENFDATVLNKNYGWFINFYNRWCGHCINFAPHWKKLGRRVAGKLKVTTSISGSKLYPRNTVNGCDDGYFIFFACQIRE